jgi:hypothetical protein
VKRSGAVFGLGVLVLFACGEDDHDAFRDDVLACEEAVAHLESCCPDLHVEPNACAYSYDHDSGCGSSTDRYEYPALTTLESQCIRDRGCGDIVRGGMCERAATLAPRESETTVTGDHAASSAPSVVHAAVCP